MGRDPLVIRGSQIRQLVAMTTSGSSDAPSESCWLAILYNGGKQVKNAHYWETYSPVVK
jgi:hypothetical protein